MTRLLGPRQVSRVWKSRAHNLILEVLVMQKVTTVAGIDEMPLTSCYTVKDRGLSILLREEQQGP